LLKVTQGIVFGADYPIFQYLWMAFFLLPVFAWKQISTLKMDYWLKMR